MSGIDEEVDGGKTGRHERSPPPIVVFSCQVEVTQQNGRFRAGYD